MRIGFLGSKGVPGHHGVEVVIDSLVPHLTSMGHQIVVYGYDSYTKDTRDYHGAEIKTVSGSSRKNLEMISHMWNASRQSRQEGFDIVHIHSADPCLLAWLPRAKYGMVATSHGQAYVRNKWNPLSKSMSKLAERCFMSIPDVRTSVSKPLADYYQNKYGKEVLYIPNGINFRDKPDRKHLEKWDLSPRGFLFCSAGRIEKTKGIHTLLEAYQQASVDIPLIIAGGGSGSDTVFFDELRAGSPKNARFVGFLTGDEFFSLYAHAKIFIFPSEYEAMSMALLEGLSFGTPTIYSNIQENEAVADGLGYRFDVADAGSLAGQIRSVLGQYDDALKLGEKAYTAVREKHDWRAVAAQYNRVYEQLGGAGI